MEVSSDAVADLWVQAAALVLARFATRHDLAQQDVWLSVSLGDPVRHGAAFQRGFRGPATTEGRAVQRALHRAVWDVDDGAVPVQSGFPEQVSGSFWSLMSVLGVPVGVVQVYKRAGLAGYHRANIWVPAFSECLCGSSFQAMNIDQAVHAMELFDTLTRIDHRPADEALAACLLLAENA